MYIKLRRLQWAGHVVRMDDKRTPKRVLVGSIDGKRPKGRARKNGKMLSLWMEERCWECEDRSPLLLIERSGGSG